MPWELDPAMRRRFEKRVYIALPEPSARSTMFRLNVGTEGGHTVNDEEFEMLGRGSEGYSGSDISVVVREAIYEPLRKCQQAKQFIVDSSNEGSTGNPSFENPSLLSRVMSGFWVWMCTTTTRRAIC